MPSNRLGVEDKLADTCNFWISLSPFRKLQSSSVVMLFLSMNVLAYDSLLISSTTTNIDINCEVIGKRSAITIYTVYIIGATQVFFSMEGRIM